MPYKNDSPLLIAVHIHATWHPIAAPRVPAISDCDMKIYDASGKLHLHHGLEESGPQGKPQKPEDIRPEIDRTILRQILLEACPADAIKWDHALTSAIPLGNGQHELTFANGTKTVCDILVGADGAHSRIRPLVSPVTPFYSGVNGVEISLAPAVASPQHSRSSTPSARAPCSRCRTRRCSGAR